MCMGARWLFSSLEEEEEGRCWVGTEGLSFFIQMDPRFGYGYYIGRANAKCNMPQPNLIDYRLDQKPVDFCSHPSSASGFLM